MKHLKHVCTEVTKFELGKTSDFLDMNNTRKLWQEHDDYGNHRLCYDCHVSEWTSYQGISSLDVTGVGMFRGTTDYYKGTLPRVFQMFMSLEDSLGTFGHSHNSPHKEGT